MLNDRNVSVTDAELAGIARETVETLKERGLTVSLAESCTGGLIAKLITDVPGASSVFECGIVSYSGGVKKNVLGVGEDTLAAYGEVSAQTVEEMAAGAMRLSGSDCAVAVSGSAGPTPDEPGKPVGLIWIAAAVKDRTVTKELYNEFSDDIRENNRRIAAAEGLRLLRATIAERCG